MSPEEFRTLAGKIYLMGYPEEKARELAQKIKDEAARATISEDTMFYLLASWLNPKDAIHGTFPRFADFVKKQTWRDKG